MRASVIVDNIESGGIPAEWGLCIYIEYNDSRILLDCGSTELFVHNASLMGIPLEDVDAAVLSHGHSDHAGGMREFFAANSTAKFYLRSGCGETCYQKKWVIFRKYCGIPRGVLKEYRDRIRFASGDEKIAEGVWLIPHKSGDLSYIGKRDGLYAKDEKGRIRPDGFVHEQSLVFETPQGLVIFNSCCHAGADTVIKEVRDTFPGKPIRALIGGFHLHDKTDEFVRAFAGRVRDAGVGEVVTGHCTGQRAFEVLKEELGEQAKQLHTGLVLEY